MMFGTLALAYGFGSSERLAGAHGTAVSTTMLLTTALLYNAMRDIWRWPIVVALLVSGIFLLIDGAFFAANLLKLSNPTPWRVTLLDGRSRPAIAPLDQCSSDTRPPRARSSSRG